MLVYITVLSNYKSSAMSDKNKLLILFLTIVVVAVVGIKSSGVEPTGFNVCITEHAQTAH